MTALFLSSPQTFEPMPGNAGVMGCVLGIAVAEVVLHGAQVRAFVGERVATGTAQHMRPDFAELCFVASLAHEVVEGLAGKLALAFRYEQPGQIVLTLGQVALQRPELVASNRMLG